MTERTVADTTVAPLVGSLPPQCRKDVDTLCTFIRSAIGQWSPAAAVSPADFREVFLTGATGFVGRFILRDLLQHNQGLVVHCIVRAASADHGFQRLRAALQQAEIWDEAFTPRIRVVVGDIEEARFGLDEAAFNDLCQRIDAVYHLAANLNLFSSYAALRKVNTLTMRNVLELGLRTRYKPLFYASTMGVFPQYFCVFSNEFRESHIDHQMQPDLVRMKQTFPLGFLGYPWSKLVAEQALLFANRAGMPVAVFRLPQTGTASTGFTQADALTVRIGSAMIDVEMMPKGFTIHPINEAVDTLSRMCTAVSMNPRRRFTIYHCCNPQPVRHDLELADFGLSLREVSYTSFKRACQARGNNSPLHGYWTLLDHFAPYWFSDNKANFSIPVCDRAIREDCPHPIKWPGLLTLFRRSGDWIRRQQKWPYSVPQSRLDFDGLMTRAACHAERVGVAFERAYPEWMCCGLKRLVQALNAPEARLLKARVGDVAAELSRVLRNNAALARERQQHPEIEREEITQPVFIVGINRSGTTFLHRLLARDPRFWTLRLYDYRDPVRPTEECATLSGTPADSRRAAVEDQIEASGIKEKLAGIHHIDIDEPEEDFSLLSMAFASWILTVSYHVPDFSRWLAATGSQHAYTHHYRTMQHFAWQRRPECPGQWLFKMPLHLMELETLIKTYPDALFIQTHREPTQFMGSWNHVVELARSLFSEPHPPSDLGAEQLAFMSDMLDKAVNFRTAHPELERRWMDVVYFDLIEDPFAIVRSIYEYFGWTLEPEALHKMEDWHFRQAEKRQTEKRHRYDLKDYGLTPEMVTAAFARYRDFLTTRGIRASRV